MKKGLVHYKQPAPGQRPDLSTAVVIPAEPLLTWPGEASEQQLEIN